LTDTIKIYISLPWYVKAD